MRTAPQTTASYARSLDTRFRTRFKIYATIERKIVLKNLSFELHATRKSGGGGGPDVEPSLVDAALICKEFLNLRHVIECGLLSGLLARPDRCRWPRW